MKTNKAGKQNILFLHVEKIVFFVLIMAAGYYCYSAASLPQITWTPQQLDEDAKGAQQTIEKSEFREDLKIVSYDEKARDIRTGFPPTNYATVGKWEPAVFPEKIFRENPSSEQLFTVIRLRATSFVGAVMTVRPKSVFDSASGTGGDMMQQDMGTFGADSAMGGGMGMATNSANIETMHWVLLTGLIPYEDQVREYTRLYANALNATPNDYPVYLEVKIQRNEIGVNDADGSPRWVDIDAYNQYIENRKKWANVGFDPVDFSYTLPPPTIDFQPMASLLPPLANRQFGSEVAYPPYIPLMSDSLRDQMRMQQDIQWKLLESQRNITIEDIKRNLSGELDSLIQGGGASGLGSGPSSSMEGGSGGRGSVSGMFVSGGVTNTASGGMGMETGMMGMGGSTSMDSGMGMGGAMGNTWTVYTRVPPSVVVNMKYRLFRYFDFTVQPGKSYQYRVSLGLKNPNFKMHKRFLSENAEKTQRDLVFYTDYSAPSGKVAVNSNAVILVQQVGNPPAANREWQAQNATVASIVFDTADNKDFIAKGKNVAPGMVLNFARTSSQDTSQLIAPTTGMGGSDMTDSSGRPAAPAKTPTKTLDHVSGECIVDVVGKKKLIGTNADHTPTGQVMMMAFDGTLSIRSVKEDKLQLDRYEKPAVSIDRKSVV